MIASCSPKYQQTAFLSPWSPSTSQHSMKAHDLTAVNKLHCSLPKCPPARQQAQVVFSLRLHQIHLLEKNLRLISANSSVQTPSGVTVHTLLPVLFPLCFSTSSPLSLSHVSVVCVRSPDPWPTGKQLPACLSIATKLLYIMA